MNTATIIPRFVRKSLNSATSGLGGTKFYIKDLKTQCWLLDTFGLVTDDNRHEIGNYVVDFCWIMQTWFVSFEEK
jgi:hypothetical protein